MKKGKYLANNRGRTPRRPQPVQDTPQPEQEIPATYLNDDLFAESPAVGTPAQTPRPERQPATQVSGNTRRPAPKKKKLTPAQRAGRCVLRTLGVLLTLVAFVAIVLVCSVKMICGSTSPSAKKTFVTTMLETGQLKFMATMFVPADEIQAIVDANSMEQITDTVNNNLIRIPDFTENDPDPNAKDIEVIKIAGSTYTAHLIKVRDPSRISLATIYPWRDTGVTLEELVKQSGALAAINGGIYNSTNNTGGRPYGIIVCDGQIQHNQPSEWPGLVLIGFDSNNILQIIDVDGMTPAQAEAMIREKGIRDAVTFQEEASDKNNHFVQLIINGNPRGMNGAGSGLNPRTAIGQCADGSVLLLVTDGRGKDGHLGASAADLIEIMTQYGAVNAANLDGGSSSCMYYENDYLMTSVTFYYSNSSWKLPAAFIVK